MKHRSTRRSVTLPRGFRAAGATCGIKPSGQPDVALIVSDNPCAAAGLFTQSRLPGAPVIVSRRHLKRGRVQAIVCNSGISNVATGQRGIDDAGNMAKQVAGFIGCAAGEVLVASTGVIGHYLPMDKVGRGIEAAASNLARGPAADAHAARAVMTTDLVPKLAHRRLRISDKLVTIGGIAKGSGMIAPNMATMLAFITTDAAIDTPLLRKALREAVATSFNRITIDQDTSTSDSVFLLAGGGAGNRPITSTGRNHHAFVQALKDLCCDLAYQLVRDGEGATRVFRVVVNHAAGMKDADRIGRTVAASPLVKTAVHGADPNWGRLIMAIGRSGAAVRPSRLMIHIADICVLRNGRAVEIDAPTRRRLERSMKRKEVTFTIDLGGGKGTCQWLGCDLSRQYVAINADYTT